MKKLHLILLFITAAISVHSQTTAWFSSADLAKTYAIENKVPILLVFGGSDWCKPCMMLKADILHNSTFEAFYPSQMAILYLDFPMQAKHKLPADLKKQNELLAEKYNKSGAFPALILIDSNGRVLGNLKYNNQTPAVFIDQCKSLLATIPAK